MLPAVILVAGSALAALLILRWLLELRQAETLRRLEAALRSAPMPISSAVRPIRHDATGPARGPARCSSHESSPKAGARVTE